MPTQRVLPAAPRCTGQSVACRRRGYISRYISVTWP
ncbi:hypothetical protein Rrhod_2465 [Rhodococcus rhodnii LMG 5362]|uniref:Uncharacterized protein n=1 Tax=Rhodococcus rhodnii LMG 5362 TaxID=1273125 RepID=R7WQ20_9NOCA|nr:hypothetical protein Rrhod_2465 [Rhodococcus rhodnii LMG 5362]